ncbi:uncharacterized mitochondrial protein AtMg00810-like [Panicum virgatum]|uniref:uncharacterized mitochondrial protein AtMg00810-like n=1 Tax=Panicum virgatum TaxID=38727 RepID=UPI0019D69662|nr:uncharacterized mitochondrial protein AtMg00810-like [Panicum virgatum]
MKDKEYIVFGDNSRGKVRGVGAIRISDDFTLREVALVDKLGFNLLSISQLLDDGYEFFLGLHIKQTRDGTFIHQDKYTKDMLKKFDFGDLSPMPTPMSTSTVLDEDTKGVTVDQKEYRSMIDSLLYLMATRPDIQFAVYLCARWDCLHH